MPPSFALDAGDPTITAVGVTAAAFSAVAREYERGRPGYPSAAIDRLSRELALGAGSTVVDLAAGTGKLTRDLAPRFARVIAVEPLDEMRAVIERTLPAVEAVKGSAEEMPPDGGCADAVFVAQAFHWFDGPRALAEIARVLRPGGGLGLLWNSTPWENRDGPWFSALDDLLEQSRADLSTLRRHGSGEWTRAFDGDHPFEPLQYAEFENPQRATRADFLAALASRSYVASMEAADRKEFLAEVEQLLERPDAPLEGDEVVMPLRTYVFWTRLRASPPEPDESD
jgi:ubiquinone/menaquinone biosynthesis C-methylase UbiE